MKLAKLGADFELLPSWFFGPPVFARDMADRRAGPLFVCQEFPNQVPGDVLNRDSAPLGIVLLQPS